MAHRARRALISVSDKSGIVELGRALSALGIEILSTGGTAKLLADAGVAVVEVSDHTGFPEMLDGRVKTIHPRIAGGILAIRANPAHMQALAAHAIPTIDLLVVNLYDFAAAAAKPGVTIEELIENIDIGGPTMIRAAAKNHQDVAIVTDPADYASLLGEMNANGGVLSLKTRWDLARKAYALTARYDAAITSRLSQIEVEEGRYIDQPAGLPATLSIQVPSRQILRYGENPHQQAALYAAGQEGVANGEQLHGKELSYNNLVDLDAAWQLIQEFSQPAAAIIKHTNPCGCAENASLAAAYRLALEADPVSAFGGVLAFNREVDEDTALEVSKLFVEAIAAPGFSAKALSILTSKKNLRLVKVRGGACSGLAVKSISGGFLVQSADAETLNRSQARIVTQRGPSVEEWQALEFAWKVAKHVKSNAIVYARAGQLIAAGAGQMSRVDAVKVGAMKAVLPLKGSVVASDAFFPFRDGLDNAAAAGIKAVIQPGGSMRDDEVIAAANGHGIAMVFTGVRHFRH